MIEYILECSITLSAQEQPHYQGSFHHPMSFDMQWEMIVFVASLWNSVPVFFKVVALSDMQTN
ncbi:uncharacterized protein G2W53_008106 [Senna tora]|uniref:Uncharacterized protein n=1 Tax=Senna tora TaxID=362788 RepID=A0A835CEX3_9FABA|nr:uncharacterized protein G2W53_008106 [Senna tora]